MDLHTHKPGKKTILAAACVLVAGALLLTAFAGTGKNSAGAETVYRESTVTRGDITVGVSEIATAALKTHNVSFATDVELAQVLVKAGQAVNAGDPVATLAPVSIEEELADLNLSLKKAQLELSQAQLSQQKGALTAKNDFDTNVAKSGTAETAYKLDLAQLQNDVTAKEIATLELQKEIAKVQGYLENDTLVSPCDGVVTAVNFAAGDAVGKNTAIATISDSGNVQVYVAIAQDDIAGISLGQEAAVALDAFDELAMAGVVDSISNTPARSSTGSASYNVTVQLTGDTSQVFEGMTGTVTLILRQQKDVLYVSTRCVTQRDGQSFVKTRESEDGPVVEVPVETGFSDGRNVEITGGLAERQTVLIESQVVATP